MRSIGSLLIEARRRRMFRTAALYVVGAWLVLQIADVLFPGFGIPDTAIQTLLLAAVLGFPVALVFGWYFEIGSSGIRRTPPAGAEGAGTALALQRSDYLILAALAMVAIAIVYNATREVIETPREAPMAAGDAAEYDFEPLPKLDNSVAVLPFANISDDPDNAFFCDGVSEEILNRLGAYRELNVIGRTSSFAFKDVDIALPKISALLGVRYLLQGSVRKYGDQLRIAAQLVNEAGVQVWNQSFDRELKNVFAIQTEIAEAVAANVAPQVAPLEQSARIPDIAAYEHYLKGRELLHRRSREPARAEFNNALALDPEFAEAHAELAIALLIGRPDESRLEQAESAIERALTLRPRLLRAQAARGLLLTQRWPRDDAAAVRVLRRVLAQDPNMVDAMNWLAGSLNYLGQDDEAMVIFERAARIDPLHPAIGVNLATALFARGEEARAGAILQRLLAQPDPGYGPFLTIRGIHRYRGDLVAMHEVAREQLLRIHSPNYWSQTFSYGLLGDWERAEYWSRRQMRERPQHFFSPFMSVLVPRWQGRFEDAWREVQRALDEMGSTLPELNPVLSQALGPIPATLGDCETSIELLEPAVQERRHAAWDAGLLRDEINASALQALAWCYRQSGRSDEAGDILGKFEDLIRHEADFDSVYASQLWYTAARNAVVAEETDLALQRLEQAVAAGWREVYVYRKDPLWKPLWKDPRYVELMQSVKTDVDAQRAVVDALDAEQDLAALYDAHLAAGTTRDTAR